MNHTTPNTSLQTSSDMARLRITRKVMIWLLLFFGYSIITQAQDDRCEDFMNFVCNGDVEFVKILLNNNKNIDVQDDYGWTALMHAIVNDQFEIAELLIEHGAKLDIKNDHGFTALMIAAFFNYIEAVQILLEKGAHKNIQNIDGNTALTIAESKGHTKIVELLKTYGVKEWYEFWK